EEWFSLDRVVLEPLAWPGNLNKSIDESQLGNYLFEVRERASGKLLYSRGFNSVFGEWKTTDEALHGNRTFSESLRFPNPEAVVEVSLKERGDSASPSWKEVWKTVVDPKSESVDRSRPPSPGALLELQKMGNPANKVDLLVLGDGYTAAERPKFEQDARRFMEALFSTSPFREHRNEFNVWGLCPAAEESGISRPSSGIYRRSPVGASYDTFGTERYVLTTENRTLRDIASFAPYEFIEILVNGQTYGGGGIFNQYATVAIDNLWAGYVGVHEFGHQFAGLADEYYASAVAYLPPEKKTEPWEPNVTALLDPVNLKWKDLVASGTPIPTPWDKDEFDRFEGEIQRQRRELRAAGRPEAEMDELFRKERAKEDEMLGAQKYAGKVGAFEGANYEAKGSYRPEVDCIMFTRYDKFCAVCRRAIERVIGMYT
ncbi:MAG TPA: M64 family metallopeptidase, partial [Candidatus Sulfotelmatobacter sp.]|nr:M64 family metallopeptidase [Candidatus Sulfotelmatobacter sp.]